MGLILKKVVFSSGLSIIRRMLLRFLGYKKQKRWVYSKEKNKNRWWNDSLLKLKRIWYIVAHLVLSPGTIFKLNNIQIQWVEKIDKRSSRQLRTYCYDCLIHKLT